MYTYADKTKGTTSSIYRQKSQAVAHEVEQRQRSYDSGSQFVDNRPEAIAQRKLRDMVDNRALKQPHAFQKVDNHTGLPNNLKSGMENLSGMSLGHVKFHYNLSKPAAVQAHAYAQSYNIHLASGHVKHLHHELGHVVQQAQGKVKPTTGVNAVAVNNNAGLETQRDVMESKSLQLKPKQNQSPKTNNTVSRKKEITGKNDHTIQRFEGDVQETLWDLVNQVICSSQLNDAISEPELVDLIYSYATKVAPAQPNQGPSMLSNLQKMVPSAKQMGIFLKIENPHVNEVKEDYQRRKKGKGPLWNERRISLNIEPDRVLDVMTDLSGYFSTDLKNVDSVKCYASIEDQTNKMDNVVVYVIEPTFAIGQPDNDLGYQNIQHIGTNYARFLRSGRPAMSGETRFSGLGVGGGHGSLIHPRAVVIAGAIMKWLKSNKKMDLTNLVKSAFDKAGYIGLVLHENPSSK